jgi:CRISPR type III-A/MTUBE-associated protein Csm6
VHICRKYKPEKVYLYLSQEMLAFHQQDDRYCRCLKWLQEKENFYCDIQILERPDLVEVQLFDYFYDEFEQEVEKIRQMHPDDTILLNVSSGTPAMKSALQFLAVSSENLYIPVQVSTPQKGVNREQYDFELYDLETRWELDEDNEVPYVDRCVESETAMLNKRIKLEVIRKHIKAYDYQAAWRVAQTIEQLLSAETLALLDGAAKRFALKVTDAKKLFQKANVNPIPEVSSDKQLVIEYLLWLQVKQQRGDLLDFIRGVTPVVIRLFDFALKDKCKINFYDYCTQRKNGIWYPDRTKLQQKNPELFRYLETNEKICDGVRENTPLNSVLLCETLRKEIADAVIIQNMDIIRSIESDARNIAAHEIVAVTDDWLQKQVKHSSAQIMKLLKTFTQQTCIGIKSTVWDSYEQMNAMILESLNKSTGKES